MMIRVTGPCAACHLNVINRPGNSFLMHLALTGLGHWIWDYSSRGFVSNSV